MLIAGVGFLTAVVPLMLFMSFCRVPFDEQQFVTGRITDTVNIGTFSDCVKDLLADEYDAYTVNEFWYNGSKETNPDGEIRLSAYFNETRGKVECSWKMFEAQIGKQDYGRIRSSAHGTDTVVTVYMNSRFIRSFESAEYAPGG